MLNDHDFALELLKVQRLDLVDQCVAAASDFFIFIELSPRLVALLPENRRVLTITRSEFSVARVIQEYETQVVQHAIELAEVASELFRSAKRQVK